jgi:SAM-dependent MidA family methyltransferase
LNAVETLVRGRFVTELEQIIRGEIGEDGAISFARFMELALYHPSHGYYERHLKQTGREGDFFTSVNVGSLYGELLGVDFARRFAEMSGPVQLIEAGAHDGQLARDVLDYLREYEQETFRRVEYVIIEPSAGRAHKQFETLANYGGKVQWLRDWSEVGEFRGICFSNELFDAMPVHVFRWEPEARRWREWGVTNHRGQFQWKPLAEGKESPNAQKLLARLPDELLAVLPNGFTVEISPEAVSWWLRAAHALAEGWLFTVDYGLLQDDFFQPHRSRGTLRAYSKHRPGGSLLDGVGDQDITAHVNFSLLISAGESAGLQTEEFAHQGVFLKGIVEQIEKRPSAFPLWTAMRYRQLKALLHPEHLGRAFKVLSQRREV